MAPLDAFQPAQASLARGASCTALVQPRWMKYRKYVEKDAALARRFQPVMVNEPTVADTVSILRGPQGEV